MNVKNLEKIEEVGKILAVLEERLSSLEKSIRIAQVGPKKLMQESYKLNKSLHSYYSEILKGLKRGM